MAPEKNKLPVLLLMACMTGLAATYSLAGSKDAADGPRLNELKQAIGRLQPLAEKLPAPKPGDWLYHHKEDGQSFDAWRRQTSAGARKKYRVIYLLPIGPIDKDRRPIVQATAKMLEAFYNLPVKQLQPVQLRAVPDKAQRLSRWGEKQLLTGYLLDEILLPRRPKDAAALLGLTQEDLWPGEGWNFVFGQASLRRRVGVWSMRRYGDPTKSDQARRQVLLRTIRTALHETGHMFGMEHCTSWKCLMNGANSLEEADSRPLAMCPDCLAKACTVGRIDPAQRYAKLEKVLKQLGLDDQAKEIARRREAIAPRP
ncbi:MAG: archaemetzincin [Phycisphaerae bacterium]